MDPLRVEYLANFLIRKHLKSYNFDWIPKYSRKRILGICDYDNKLIMINYDFSINNNYYILKNIILHEIAHALLGERDDLSSHDEDFVSTYIKIGIKDKR